MSYQLNICKTSVKYRFKVSVKHRLVSVCCYIRADMLDYVRFPFFRYHFDSLTSRSGAVTRNLIQMSHFITTGDIKSAELFLFFQKKQTNKNF